MIKENGINPMDEGRNIPSAQTAGGSFLAEHGPLIRPFLDSRDLFFAYILALTRDLEAAEEIFQDTALAIILEEQKGTCPGDFSLWCRSLCRHRAADYFRRRVPRKLEIPFEEVAEVVERCFSRAEDTPAEGTVKVRMLRECLETLGPTTRRIVEGRYLSRLTLAQLATLHAWKKNALKTTLAKARRRLLDCLQRKLKAEGGTHA